MTNRILFIALLVTASFTNSFAQNQNDSLIEVRLNNIEVRLEEQKKEAVLKEREMNVSLEEKKIELDKEFKNLSDKLSDDYSLMKYLTWIFGGVNLLFIIGILWKGKSYVQSKLNQKFDNIITQQEGNIIEVIEGQDIEKQIIKNKKILVITAKDGDDKFLRKFFKSMGFSIDNVKYLKVDEYSEHKGFDLIFMNNDDEKIGTSLIDEYFNHSDSKTVLFYYNTTRKQYINSNVSNRLSFANSPTQIYGNLINLMKYRSVLEYCA